MNIIFTKKSKYLNLKISIYYDYYKKDNKYMLIKSQKNSISIDNLYINNKYQKA